MMAKSLLPMLYAALLLTAIPAKGEEEDADTIIDGRGINLQVESTTQQESIPEEDIFGEGPLTEDPETSDDADQEALLGTDDNAEPSQLPVDATDQPRVPLDTQADYQEMRGGHCIKSIEDVEGNVICEEYGEEPGSKYTASKAGGVGVFPILMAIITAGVIFFAVGFFYNRFKGGNNKQVFTPQQMRMKPVYKQTPTEPPADEEDYKPPVKRVPTPEIIYTTHDEPDVQHHTVPDVVLPPPPSTTSKPDVRKPMPPIGKYQSPIDIDPEEAELSDDLEKSRLVFKYVPENTKSLTNLGNTVKVMVDCRGSDLHGGPLGDKRYCLDHFRFHWGADDTRGSEHSVAGKRYAGEIQLVHWNKEDFRTFAEASRYESGLSIISVFMEVAGDQHTNLQELLDVFKSIQYKGGSVEVPHHYFDPAVLLPGNTLEYWTYPGSLTESPYPETVTWLIMKEPIKVSSAQMATFRTLMRTERDEGHGVVGEQLVDNFREQSTLGDRSLRASFH